MNEIIKTFTNRITDIWDYPKLSIYNNDCVDAKKYFLFLKRPPQNDSIRLYIHIPFCKSFCRFCQFYKEPYPKDDDKLKIYVDYVIKELTNYANTEFVQRSKISSIFFGGGDPSLMPLKFFRVIMEFIVKHYNLTDDFSFSIEGNVKSLLENERLDVYKEYNVTRISFGIQTFNEEIRKSLLLKPTYEEIEDLCYLIRKKRFEGYAFDLMYDLPDQTDEILLKDIELATKFNSDYIDFYSLNLYPNTSFYKDIYQKNIYAIKPTKERELHQNVLIQSRMEELGYKQVISCTYSHKFDVPHPGLYHFLKNGNMIGIGPSARSYLDGHSYRNLCSIKKYVSKLQNGEMPIETGRILSSEEILRRKIIFDVNLLRIPEDRVNKNLDFKIIISQLYKYGYVDHSNGYYNLTKEGRPWVGNIQKCFFSKAENNDDFVYFIKAVKEGRSAYNQDFMSIIKEKRS